MSRFFRARVAYRGMDDPRLISASKAEQQVATDGKRPPGAAVISVAASFQAARR